MTVEYPMQGWRAWARSQIIQSTSEKEAENEEENPAFSLNAQHEERKSLTNSFVLFIRLPNWEKESSRKPAEIRTLRNLKNGIQVFQVKAALELSTGLPAHITSLHGVKNERIPDDTRLILGDNIKNGHSYSLQVIGAWEEIVKGAWTGNLPHILYGLPSQQAKNKRNIPAAWQDFASIVKKAGKENSFCALFAASARGNMPVCKAIIESGDVDVNQTTFFGNSCLHSAAFNGNLEVVKLLVASGSDIRCRNVDGKSSLDLAATSNFIDCARWLWLNQWSISLSTSKTAPPSNDHSTHDATTLPKPSPPNLDRLEAIVSYHDKGSKRKPSTLQERSDGKRNSHRPQTTPVAGKTHKNAAASFNNRSQTKTRSSSPLQLNAPTRPQTAFVRFSAPAQVQQKQSILPKLLPELRASLTRERSIPSVHESRLNSQALGHLQVDVQSRTLDKPLEVKVMLSREWINPGQRNTQRRQPSSHQATFPCISPRAKSAEHKESTYQQQLENIQQQRKLKFEKFSEKIHHVPTEPVKTTKTIYVALQKPTLETPPSSPNNVLDSYENLHSGSQSSKLSQNSEESPRTLDNANSSTNENRLKNKNSEKPNSAFKSHVGLPQESKLSTINATAKTNDPKINTVLSDKQHQQEKLMKNKDVKSRIAQSAESKEMPNPTEANDDKIAKENSILKALRFDNQKPAAHVKHDQYERFKRENHTQRNETEDQKLTREEIIRKEKNKTAWVEWMAAKQKEKQAQKKAEENRKNESAVRKWGMTFDQWMESKREELEKKSVLKEAEKGKKKHRANSSGKTFEEWLKEKAPEKREDNGSENQRVKEEEREKIEEARRRSFAVWSARKLEEAKKERRQSELQEQKRMEEVQEMYDKWKSKERVMSFDSWLKKKESARALKAVTEAQKDAQAHIDSWAAQERKELAEIKFEKWVVRKESLYVQEAEQELKEAKELREKAERKSRIRRALLRAKAIMRLKAMSKSNPELRRSKRSSSSRSSSTSKSLYSTKSVHDISTLPSTFDGLSLPEEAIETFEEANAENQHFTTSNLNLNASVANERSLEETVEQEREVSTILLGEENVDSNQSKSGWDISSAQPKLSQSSEEDEITEEISTTEHTKNSETMNQNKKRTKSVSKKKKKKLQANKAKSPSKKSSLADQHGKDEDQINASSTKFQSQLTREIVKNYTEEKKTPKTKLDKKSSRSSVVSDKSTKTTSVKAKTKISTKKNEEKPKASVQKKKDNKTTKSKVSSRENKNNFDQQEQSEILHTTSTFPIGTEMESNVDDKDDDYLEDKTSFESIENSEEKERNDNQLDDVFEKESEVSSEPPSMGHHPSLGDTDVAQNAPILETVVEKEMMGITEVDLSDKPRLETRKTDIADPISAEIPLRKITIEMPITTMDDETDDTSCVSV